MTTRMAKGSFSEQRRVRSYITALLAIPLLGLLTLSQFVVRPRVTAASHAERATDHLIRTQRLVEVAAAIGREQLPVQILASGKMLGLDAPALTALLGFDPLERAREAEGHTRDLVARYQTDAVVRTVGKLMDAIRSDIQSDQLDDQQTFNQIQQLLNGLLDIWQREADAAASLPLVDGEALRRRVAYVRYVVDLDHAISDVHQAIFRVLNAQPSELDDIRLEVLRHQVHEAAAQQRVLERAEEDLVTLASELASGPATSTVNAEVNAYLAKSATNPDSRVGIAQSVKVVRAGSARNGQVNKLLMESITDAVAAAQTVRNKTRSELVSASALTIAFVVLSVLVAFCISRSITRPLDRLAQRATLVANGDLSEALPNTGGPREVAFVTAVVDDLVASLRKVQRQSAALASGSLNDEALSETAPGPLGEAVQASVNRLLRSMREQEELQEQLSHQATHDSLTGIPNRSAAMLTISQALARSTRAENQMALLFVDLDDFKQANDKGGHAVGDQALCEATKRIRNTVRTGDVVARLGGDEFLVIAENIEPAQALALSQRVIDAVCVPMQIDGLEVRVGASIGVAIPETPNELPSELLRQADAAMYSAKAHGRGRAVLFDASLAVLHAEQRSIEDDMAEALRTGLGLSLHHQPVYTFPTMSLRGSEALLRWDRPGHGPQAPSVFIPVLERSTIICDVGRWVLHEATRHATQFRQQPGCDSARVAVNISGRHLMNPSIVNDVRDALASSGLLPNALVLEITETSLVTDLPTAIAHMQQLRTLGIRIAIDDFGTGYTSVGQLSRLPFDLLKIDRTLIDQLKSPVNRRIVELVIEVGHTLGMAVIGEGIEDADQLDILRQLGCDAVQGFYLGRPMSLDQFMTVVTPQEAPVAH
jgi:diguanylate cyclase (GGDEF)-like protein